MIAQTTSDFVDPFRYGAQGVFRNFDGGDATNHNLGVEIDAGVGARVPLGEAVRDLILREMDLHMAPEPELLLILASRAAFVREVVTPALAAGKVVLADRFALSTLAYQGYGRGLPLDDVRDGLRIATGGLEPDLYIVLDIPIEESSARQVSSGVEPDRIEREGDDFLRSVRQGYLALGDSESGVRVLNGSGPPEAVQERVRKLLIEIFPETFGGSAL